MMGLPTYNGTKILDTVTSILSTLHWHFGPCLQELGLTDQFETPLPNSWAAMVLLQFCDKVVVWANNCFLAHANAGIAWEDIAATVNKDFISPDTMTRLIHNCKLH